MTDLTLALNGSAIDPYVPPTGFSYTTGSINGKLFANAYQSTSTTSAAIIYQPPPTSTIVSGSVVLHAVGSSTVGVAWLAADGNGYQVLVRASDIRVFRSTATNSTFTQTGTTYTGTFVAGDVIRAYFNKSTGAIQVYQNGVLRLTVTDTTYIAQDLRIGFFSRGGYITSFTAYDVDVFSITASTSPLVPNASSSWTSIGFTGSATLSFAGVSIPVTVASNAFTAVIPMIADNVAWPKLPATAVTVTLTQGANTATTTVDISLPVGYDTVRDGSNNPANFLGLITDDNKYLAKAFLDAANPLTTSDSWIYPYVMMLNPETDIIEKDLIVEQDSQVSVLSSTLPRTDVHFRYEGATGKYFEHSLTLDAEGEVVVIDPDISYNISDIIKVVLEGKGFIGAVPDMIKSWLKANGGVSLTIQDCEKEYLIARGVTVASIPDGWRLYFISKGYTGSLPDMWKQYWLDGAPL